MQYTRTGTAVPISQARATLFDLFDHVIADPGRTVLIARQGRTEQAALVSASYLAELEARATTWSGPTTDRVAERPAFGPGSVVFTEGYDVEAALAEENAEQARLAEAKFRALGA